MAFTPLSDRLPSLPKILAGPILRRVTLTSATVWVALKEAATVRLVVKDAARRDVLTGARATVPLGASLHIVAVTARPSAGGGLTAGDPYSYDLLLPNGRSLFTVADRAALSYTTPAAGPGFLCPPQEFGQLRIAHSSCRKPHGEGHDMLAHLDTLMADPAQRPHLLFLTGDQIYSDDVSDLLLHLLQDAAAALGMATETLPQTENRELRPGLRAPVVNRVANLTVKAREGDSHLLTFGDYCAMYLFAWSPHLWPDPAALEDADTLFDHFFGEYPPGFETSPGTFELAWLKKLRWRVQETLPYLRRFREALPAVRRALANIPTAMILDDHEVTDDLFLNREWCADVLGAPLGRRVVQNGLAACALFQSWGNSPELFEGSGPGKALLALLPGLTDRSALDKLLGLPATATIAGWAWDTEVALGPVTDAFPFHFLIEGTDYRVHFLDVRTQRSYPANAFIGDDADEPAEMIGAAGLDQQLPLPAAPLLPPKPLTFVVAPTPVFGVDYIDEAQWWGDVFGDKSGIDYERWNLSDGGFGRLLTRLAGLGADGGSRVVLLSGDVHYGYAAQIELTIDGVDAALAQLTASALKHQKAGKSGSLAAQARGYDFELFFFDHDPPEATTDPIAAGGCRRLLYIQGVQEPAPGSPARTPAMEMPNADQIVGLNNLGLVTVEADAGGPVPVAVTQTLHWMAEDGTPAGTRYTIALAPTPVTCA